MNIGIIIICHNKLAEAFLETLFSIVGNKEKISILQVNSELTLDSICEKIKREVEKLNTQYTVIFTDILGGTPCNASLKIFKNINNIHIISGLNLSMLISAISLREKLDIEDINNYISQVLEEGRKSIVDVKDFFNRKVKYL